jgi:hypothetical protein
MRRTSICPTAATETIKIIEVGQIIFRNVEVCQERQGLPGELGPAQESFLNVGKELEIHSLDEPDQDNASWTY